MSGTTFARNSMFSAIAGLFTTLGGFVSTILVARMLGVEGAGVVAFATWLITVALTVADLGIPGSLARYLPELRERGESNEASSLVRFLFGPYVVAVLAITTGFLAYAGWVWSGMPEALFTTQAGAVRNGPLFWVLVASSCLVQGLAGYLNGYLRGVQDFRRMARLSIMSAMLQVATTWVGGLMLGIPGAMFGTVVGGLVPALLIMTTLPRRNPSGVAPELRRRVTKFALESWGGYLAGAFAWSRMEIFFLELSWGSGAVGLFAVGLTLMNLATQGLLLLTGGLLPYLASNMTTAPGKAEDAYTVGMRVVAFLVLPSCLGLAAVAPTLVPWIYGQDFAEAVPATIVLVVTSAVGGTASVASTYLFARERTRFLLATGTLGAVLAIVAGLTIVTAYGPLAAAGARGAIGILVSILVVRYSERLGGITPYASLGRLLLAAGLCAVTAHLSLHFVTGPAALLLAIPVGALTYALAVRWLDALPGEDVQRLALFAEVLPRPFRRIIGSALRLLAR